MAQLTKHADNNLGVPSRLPALTGMRFIAAISVFVFHGIQQGTFASQGATSKLMSVFWQGGWTSVSFFFILSGFVLTWTARSTDRTRSFYRRRFFKVYPNHLITALVALLLIVLTNQTSTGTMPSSGTVFLNLFLIQSWSPDWTVRASLNGPAWSLSCELMFYVAFPLLFMLVRRIRPERLWAWTGVVAVVAVIAVPLIAGQVVPHQTLFPIVNLSAQQLWFVVQFPPVRALEFVFGMLMARIVLTGRRLPISFGGAVALTVLTYAVSPMFPPVLGTNALTLVPLGLVIATGAVADVQGQRSWLASRTMVWLGEVSFAFYMIHALVLEYGDYWLSGNKGFSTPVAVVVLVLMCAVVVGLAYLLFRFVEAPIMRNWARPRRKPLAPAPPAPLSQAPASEGNDLAA